MAVDVRAMWDTLLRALRFRTGDSSLEKVVEKPRPMIFMAAHVDSLTQSMSRWITAVAAQIDGANIFVGQGATTANLAGFLSRHDGDDVVVVFYGHGEVDCFLTNDSLGVGDLRRQGTCRALCSVEHLAAAQGAINVIAYCCSASKELARQLTARRRDARFLGYRDDIFFSIGTPAREAAFSAPMEAAVMDVCRTGRVDELAYQTIRSAYRIERDRWIGRGEFAGDTRAPFVAMFLLRHRRALDLLPKGA